MRGEINETTHIKINKINKRNQTKELNKKTIAVIVMITIHNKVYRSK